MSTTNTAEVLRVDAEQSISTVSVEPVETAVILAAGDGTRFAGTAGAGSKRDLPKVLQRVGGLMLLERAILSLHDAGIRRFRVVTGRHQDTIAAALAAENSLRGLNIEIVGCADYALGNGVSFASGAAGLRDSFLLTMGDHIITPSTISEFVAAASEHSARPSLACDGDLGGVFDMDDATKVRSERGLIAEIGKQLQVYDLVDTGLFFFPAGSADKVVDAVQSGAKSVSEIVASFRESGEFGALRLNKPVWQDVDDQAMFRHAEKKLLRSLIKETDGPVSKKLNRPCSLAVSRYLARFKVSPNTVTTFVFFLTIVGAWLAASPQHLHLFIAGLIFQVASILDGCDGEVARLTHRRSRFGAWYDTLTDNLRYAVFLGALGISAWRSGGGSVYLVAVVLFALIFLYAAATMARYVWVQRGPLTNLVVLAEFERQGASSQSLWDKVMMLLRSQVKQDVVALWVFLFCALGLAAPMFWLSFVGIAAIAVTISRTIGRAQARQAAAAGDGLGGAASQAQGADPFLFYLAGIVLLGALVLWVPTNELSALPPFGVELAAVMIPALIWTFTNAIGLSVLLRGGLGLSTLYMNQWVGESYNAILPLAGLGGEPYKIRHLSRWLPVSEASHAVVRERLVHAISGPLFTAFALAAGTWLVPLEPFYRNGFIMAAVVMALAALLLTFVALSRASSGFTERLLKWLRVSEDYREEELDTGRFFVVLGLKLLGRALGGVEAYLIFLLLGLEPDMGQILCVLAFIGASSIIFFVIPQGLGVNEAGISGAFALLGFAPHLGLTYGLIRRARVVVWSLLGVALHLGSLGVARLMRQRAHVTATSGR